MILLSGKVLHSRQSISAIEALAERDQSLRLDNFLPLDPGGVGLLFFEKKTVEMFNVMSSKCQHWPVAMAMWEYNSICITFH